MQCFELPKSLCDELEGLCCNFWWGQKESERKLAWINWNKLCWSKRCGVAGFRKFHNFNTTLLAKQAARLATAPHSLVARVLKARYFPKVSFWAAKNGYQPSYSWKAYIRHRSFWRRACDGTSRMGQLFPFGKTNGYWFLMATVSSPLQE